MNPFSPSVISKMVEQFRQTEKISRETSPYYPKKKDRYSRILQYNSYKSTLISSNMKQTFVTTNKHSSKINDLSKLNPINIRSMMVNKIHYGKYLICRVIEEPYKVVAISLLVEDENGEIEDLSIYNYPETEKDDYSNLFSKGTVIYIKEPFLKLPKEGDSSFIRIDSPSDILIDEFELSGNFRNDLKQFHKGKNPETIKKDGNYYYQQKSYAMAIRCYKLALSLNPSQNFILHLNCSAAYLASDMPSQALSEASKALKAIFLENSEDQKKWIEKATFRMGKALCEMRQWKEALNNLQECLTVNSMNQEALSLFKETKLRIKEQEIGEFDFLQIYDKFQNSKIYDLDVADYHHKSLIIQETSMKGRHIVAKGDIPKGTLICVSKAFSFGVFNEQKETILSINLITNIISTQSQSENLKNLFQKVHSNPFLAKEVYSLYSKNIFDRKEIIPDNIVDISRLESILSANDFDGEDSGTHLNEGTYEKMNHSNKRSSGLWIYPSLFNHSCVPNTTRNFIGDILILNSCRDIKKDEEITNSYISSMTSYEEREKHLNEYGFKCDCELCQIDRADKHLKYRTDLINNYHSEKNESNQENIERLLNSVEKTYESRKKFKFLILKPLFIWQNWLFSNHEYEKCAKSHIEGFEILKDIIPDLACLIALKVKYCYELAKKNSEAEKWLIKAKDTDVFHNFDFFLKRFKNIIKS